MAHVDSKGMVRGTVGPVVYRTYRNKNIIQGKPKAFKQTKGSKKASTEFGLSSSTAAVIRRAFEPAYIHRDGAAVSRSTQLVYRALRNSLSGTMGQRDLHDANLQDLLGMDFNANSKLNEVLQISHEVSKDDEGNVQVTLGNFDPKKDVRKVSGMFKNVSLYRIRLTLIAFDFRKEYLEYLDLQDIDFTSGSPAALQTIILKGTTDRNCMMLVSMSLLLYGQVDRTCEYILLNNKNFSPCALIGAFQAPEPSALSAKPLQLSKEAFPDRYTRIREMGYAGNQLIAKLSGILRKSPPDAGNKASPKKIASDQTDNKPLPQLRKKLSFKKA